MRTLRALVIASVLSGSACYAADREFREIVRAISDEYGTRPVHIPLFGLVKTFTGAARSAGAKQLDVAIFEDLNTRRGSGRDLAVRLKEIAGRSWKPFVEVRSRHGGQDELVLVYMRPEGADLRLLVTTVDREEATVVQMKLNQDGIRRWFEHPAQAAVHDSDRRGTDRDDGDDDTDEHDDVP